MNKKRVYRKKKANEDEEDDNVFETLQERKELQKFRQRPTGINTEELLVTNKKVEVVKEDKSDPFKIKSGGGLTEVAAKKTIGTSFSIETNQRDEDVQLLKYIEEGLKKNKGDEEKQETTRKLSMEDKLYELPESIDVKSKIMKSEEMLSSQMLSGIPEVDLGIEAKIKNIEATEEAKMKIMDEGKNRRKESSEFVPTNMASNFVHHRRFYNEKEVFEKERKKELAKQKKASENVSKNTGPTVGKDIVDGEVVVVDPSSMLNNNTSGDKRKKQETSDDYVFENFKKKTKAARWR